MFEILQDLAPAFWGNQHKDIFFSAKENQTEGLFVLIHSGLEGVTD